jgi:acetolactate synthase-1/2/3 large subunit
MMLVAGFPARPGPATYFTGARALRVPLAAAAELLAAGHGHDWPPDVGRDTRLGTGQRLAEAASAAPGTLAPQQVAVTARARLPRDCIATVDAGAHMLAVMPLWEVAQPHQLLISSGLATMGFALHAGPSGGGLHRRRRAEHDAGRNRDRGPAGAADRGDRVQ